MHPDAHVRALVIVKPDEPSDAITRLMDVAKAAGGIDEFLLDYTIDTLRNGIVRRIGVFRHAYCSSPGFKFKHISIGTVLDSPIRMVNQSQEAAASLSNRLHQGLDRVTCLQAVRKTPAHYLMRIGVCDQMQITAVILDVNVRYITDPQGIWTDRFYPFGYVRVLVETMIGTGRMARLGTRKRKLATRQ